MTAFDGIILEQTDPGKYRQGGNRGYVARDWDAYPFACQAHAAPFPADMIIPRSEWRDRYEAMKRDGTFLSVTVKASGFTVHDQKNTNYCWAQAVVACQEIARIKQNDPHIRLSAASVAAPIKRFKNYGGWGSEALDYTVENGTATDATWAEATIRPSGIAISRADAERKHFRSLEFYELPPGGDMLDCFVSALFRRWPCAPGYNHWRHQVCATDPWLAPSGKWGSYGPNSWSANWGDAGWYRLEGRKSIPDDCICLHSMTPSPGPDT